MQTPTKRSGPGRTTNSRGEAIADLILDVAQFFFRIGAFGFIRSLALLGPLTIPEIAKMRPTSRQRMQRLADELAAEGLVEFVDNPRHRRSKLVRLTRKGNRHYHRLNVQLLAIASTMGADLIEADIRKSIEIVRQLSDEMKDVAR